MKWIIWSIGGVLAAVWTGVLALTASLVAWTSSALQQAGGAMPSGELPAMALPAWLTAWIGPDTLQAWQAAAVQALDAVKGVLPHVGAATGWLEPVVWIVWGLGMLALLLVAVASHWLAGRRRAPEAMSA